MEAEILKIVLLSVKHITHVYGEPEKVAKYGNSIIITFKNGLKYKLGLMSLFDSKSCLDTSK